MIIDNKSDYMSNFSEDSAGLQFSDVFDVENIQHFQDMFSEATGVASIITFPDGKPITRPGNFCRLCNDVIRKTPIGLANCIKSNALQDLKDLTGTIVQPCLICGLLTAGTKIVVGGCHVANWLIGQVQNEHLDKQQMVLYADEIGADRMDFIRALEEVPYMSVEKFNSVAKMLFAFSNELAEKAYNNLLLKNQIAENTKAIQLLEETKVKFESLYMNMAEGVALHQLTYDETGEAVDYVILEVNPAFSNLLNIPRETVIGKTSRQAYGVSEPPYLAIYSNVAQTAEPVVFETYFEPLGKYFSISVYCPFKGAFATVFQDITDRKRAELRLISNEAKYRLSFSALYSIFESPIDIIIFSLDVNYCYTAFTKYHKEIIKKIWGADIQIGMNILEVIRDPGDRIKARENFDRALNGEYFILFEEYGDKALYRTFYEDYYSAIKDDEGSIIGVSVFVIDVTKRKQAEAELRESEARFRNLLEDVQTISVQGYGQDGTTQYWNKASERLYGYTAQEAIGRNLLDLIIPPEMYEAVKQGIKQMAESGLPVPAAELLLMRKDGSRVSVFSSHTIINIPGKAQEFFCIDIDLTERKQAEMALQLSEEKFRNLVWDMQVGILIQGPHAEILLSNPQALNLLGISEDQLLGKTSFDPDWNVIHEDGSPFPGSTHPVPQAIETRKSVRNVIMGVYRPADHSRVWLLVDAEPQLNADGSVRQVVCSFIDISKRKQAEKALQESEEKHRILFMNSPDAYLIIQDGVFIDCNVATESMLQGDRSMIIGKSPDMLSPEFQPNGKSSSVASSKMIEIALQSGQNSFEWMHRRFDGTDFMVEVSIARMLIEGRNVLFTSWRDITSRKHIEQALRETNAFLENLINYANAPIIVWDPQFRITRFNHAFEFITGRSEAEVLGKSLKILFPPEQSEEYMSLIQKTLFGERWETVEIDILNIDGSVHTVLWNSATLYLPDMITPLATIAQGQEITQRKKAELEINLKNAELIRLNAEKDKFFSIIAHDLRSPFNSFLGLTQIMAEELPSLTMAQIQTIAVNMRNSASNLFRLLENLLQWAGMQQGLIPFSPVNKLLVELVDESLAMVFDQASNKGVTIINNVQDEIMVYCDTRMIQTVLRNLVSNAVKFTPGGGGVNLFARAVNNKFVEIVVQDTGIGMSKELLDKLFRLDEQTSRRGTDGEPSTGLGLLLCKDFIERHKGKIWAESDEGKGSRFYFTLPGHENQ